MGLQFLLTPDSSEASTVTFGTVSRMRATAPTLSKHKKIVSGMTKLSCENENRCEIHGRTDLEDDLEAVICENTRCELGSAIRLALISAMSGEESCGWRVA